VRAVAGPTYSETMTAEPRTTNGPSTPVVWTDPRDEIEFSVRMANGRLAPRAFANREEAERWARPEEGDEVVSFNHVCACDM